MLPASAAILPRCWMPLRPRGMSRYWREAGSVVTALDPPDAGRRSVRRRAALLRDRPPLPAASIWRGALAVQWCDDRHLASCRVVRPGGGWRLARCWPTRCRAQSGGTIDDHPFSQRSGGAG
jgi:hypothetical protein